MTVGGGGGGGRSPPMVVKSSKLSSGGGGGRMSLSFVTRQLIGGEDSRGGLPGAGMVGGGPKSASPGNNKLKYSETSHKVIQFLLCLNYIMEV